MKAYPMPGGIPVWHSDLSGIEIDKLFGFVEAFVYCPSHITRPFLPVQRLII